MNTDGRPQESGNNDAIHPLLCSPVTRYRGSILKRRRPRPISVLLFKTTQTISDCGCFYHELDRSGRISIRVWDAEYHWTFIFLSLSHSTLRSFPQSLQYFLKSVFTLSFQTDPFIIGGHPTYPVMTSQKAQRLIDCSYVILVLPPVQWVLGVRCGRGETLTPHPF